MRNKENLKTVRKTVLMTEETANSIKCEAEERGIKPNAVMNERLNHYRSDNTPAKMVEFQDFANMAVKMMEKYSHSEAEKLQKEAHKKWTF